MMFPTQEQREEARQYMVDYMATILPEDISVYYLSYHYAYDFGLLIGPTTEKDIPSWISEIAYNVIYGNFYKRK
jgi:hypothetical protein